jgi:hypothetical protein
MAPEGMPMIDEEKWRKLLLYPQGNASQRKALSPYVQCAWHSPEEDLAKAAGVTGAATAPIEPAAAWDD